MPARRLVVFAAVASLAAALARSPGAGAQGAAPAPAADARAPAAGPATRTTLDRLKKSLADAGSLAADGQFDAALEATAGDLAALSGTFGPDHPDVGAALLQRGELYFAKGALAQTERLYVAARAVLEKSYDADDPRLSRVYADLAQLYEAEGDYGGRAEGLLQRALAISEKAFGPDGVDVGSVAERLGRLCTSHGDLGRAEALLLRARDLQGRNFAVNSTQYADVLADLGAVYAGEGKLQEAVDSLGDAISFREGAAGRNQSPALSVAQIPLFHGRALREIELATVKRSLGGLFEHTGAYSLAGGSFQSARELLENVLGPEDPRVAQLRGDDAMNWAHMGFLSLAIESERRSVEGHERQVAGVVAGGPEAQKRVFLDLSGEIDLAVSLAVTTSRADAARVALDAALNRKGRALDETEAALRAVRGALDPEGASLLDRYARASKDLAERAWAVLTRADRDPERRGELATLAARRDEVEAALSAKAIALRSIRLAVSVDRVQAALPADAALVEWVTYRPIGVRTEPWPADRAGEAGREMDALEHRAHAPPADFRGPPRMAAAVLTSAGDPVWIDLGDASAIDGAVGAVQKAFASPRGDPKPAARALEATVFAPIRQQLGKLGGRVHRLFLAPDGRLDLVPFDALVDDENRFLVERWSLSYVTSGRDLVRPRVPARPREEPVLVAPTFGPAPVAAGRAVRGLSLGNDPVPILPLPGAEKEVEAVAERVPRARRLVGAEATEAALKALHGPRLLHVATHGFFLPAATQAPGTADIVADHPLLRSGLVLSDAGRRSGEDGILSGTELSALDLNGTAMVVLSACETGSGDASTAEGVYGLRRALAFAGAESQVLSLWKVQDDATRALMASFYDGLARGEGRADALRQAELDMLRRPKSGWTHPYYWAAFLLSGEPGRLDWTVPLASQSADTQAARHLDLETGRWELTTTSRVDAIVDPALLVALTAAERDSILAAALARATPQIETHQFCLTPEDLQANTPLDDGDDECPADVTASPAHLLRTSHCAAGDRTLAIDRTDPAAFSGWTIRPTGDALARGTFQARRIRETCDMKPELAARGAALRKDPELLALLPYAYYRAIGPDFSYGWFDEADYPRFWIKRGHLGVPSEPEGRTPVVFDGTDGAFLYLTLRNLEGRGGCQAYFYKLDRAGAATRVPRLPAGLRKGADAAARTPRCSPAPL